MYSPTQGRFITNDPIGFDAGDMNLYRFVGNNPANLTDPSGLASWELIDTATGPDSAWNGDYIHFGQYRIKAMPQILFEQARGSWATLLTGTGTWSQPWWAGDGGAEVKRGKTYWGRINAWFKLTGEGEEGGVCNTPQTRTNDYRNAAGSIRIRFKNFKPGLYAVVIAYWAGGCADEGSVGASVNLHVNDGGKFQPFNGNPILTLNDAGRCKEMNDIRTIKVTVGADGEAVVAALILTAAGSVGNVSVELGLEVAKITPQ